MTAVEPKYKFQIRDLDCLTVKEEVEEALKRDFPYLGKVKVGLTPESLRGQGIYIVSS